MSIDKNHKPPTIDNVSAWKGREVLKAMRDWVARLERDPEDMQAWRSLKAGAVAMLAELGG